VRLIVTTALFGLLVVLLAVMIAVAGLLVVHRLVPLSIRESHTAAIGIIYAALYVMFGLMVGFSAYIVLNKYNTSQNTVKSEASNVEELYWLAEQLPEPKRDEIQDLAVSYARVVVDEEWPLMKGGQTSPRARTLADDLRRSIEDFEPGSSAEQAVYAQELERVHDLDQAREVRLLNVSEGLPPVLWFVLVSLGLDTILFTYFVGMKARWATRIGCSGTDRGHRPHNLRDLRPRSPFRRRSSRRSRRVRTGVGHGRRRRHPIASSQIAVLARIACHYERTRRQNRRGACPSGTF
jgi:hypothetical protein